jgi:NodT family efflux transporter outer membrane factor (OMF) lipoprotein
MKQLSKWLLIGVLALSTGGCSHPTRELRPSVDMPEAFSRSGTQSLSQQWWQAFGDDELDALIDKALTDTFDLRAAWDRLVQAQAIARKTDASLLPQADLAAGARRSRQETADTVSYSSLYSAGLAAGYEVDLWSRLDSVRKAAWLDAQAQREAVDTAAITLSASIANTWYQLAEAKGQMRIAREQIRTNEKVLKIVDIRRRKGVARAADFYRQQQLVASTEAQLIVAEEAAELLQYQLSVLIGNKPELAWEDVSGAFPDLPPMPRLGVPADVLLRRPDVRQGYRQVQAADQRLAAAIADQYPRISISANVETSSATSVRDLFDDWLANLAANAVQPLFDGARRKAEVQRQQAVAAERIDNWSQTVLDALQDVEAALTRQEQQSQLLANIEYQIGLARLTYARNGESYIKGQVDYIRVLESLQSMQSLERNVVTAQRTLIERRIDLYRSIAGPCDPPQPEPAQSGALQEATRTNSGSLIQGK